MFRARMLFPLVIILFFFFSHMAQGTKSRAGAPDADAKKILLPGTTLFVLFFFFTSSLVLYPFPFPVMSPSLPRHVNLAFWVIDYCNLDQPSRTLSNFVGTKNAVSSIPSQETKIRGNNSPGKIHMYGNMLTGIRSLLHALLIFKTHRFDVYHQGAV